MAKKTKRWSGRVTRESHAMDILEGTFNTGAKQIAQTLKRSAEHSHNLKSSPFRSAMSMLNFFMNRGGKNLSAAKKKKLNSAKVELRRLFHKEA